MKGMRITLISMIAGILFFVRCGQTQKDHYHSSLIVKQASFLRQASYLNIDSFLKSVVKTSDLGNKVYIVLPTNIGETCVKRFKQFIMAMVKGNPNLVFILTGTGEEILLVYTMDVMSSPNAVVDRKSLYQKTEFSQNIAQAFYYDKGQLSKQASIHESRIHVELMNLEPYGMPEIINGVKFLRGDSPAEIIELESTANANYNKKISDFQLKSLNDKVFKLSDHKGKVIVINFWYKGCAYCVLETPDLNRIGALAKKKNFLFLSVTTNSREELVGYIEPLEDHFKYVRKFRDVPSELKFDIFPNGKNVADSFQVSAFPQTIIIDKEGRLKRVVGYWSIADYSTDREGKYRDYFYNILTKEIDKYL